MPQPKKISHLTLILACVLFALILSGCQKVLHESVTVAGVSVGGLTKDETRSVLENSVQKNYQTKTMSIAVGDHYISISPEQAGISLNIDGLMEGLFKNKNVSGNFDITPYFSINEKSIHSLIDETEEKYFSAEFHESGYQVVGELPDLTQTPDESFGQHLVLYMGMPQFTLDTDGLYKEILNCYLSGCFQFDYPVASQLPNELSIQSIYDALYIAPVDAVMDMETFEVSPHSYGYTFDLEEAKSALETAQYGEAISIPFETIPPEVFHDDLSSLLYRDVLSTFTAYSSSQWGRDINLKLSCEAINGTVLYPGEVFSYNPALGERTPERGWQEADGYVGSETVKQYGGGICQASSCLYLCAMLADMEIVHRVNHGFISSYMPYGMDATVSWGGPEFLFKNSSEYPIRIEASASGGTVTVSLIGTDTKDYYVKMDYEILDTDPFETVEQEFPPDNPDGYKDGEVIISPYTGYKIVTYRCKYDKATDELISREKEALSIYDRRDKVVCKIVEPEPIAPPETAPSEPTPSETAPSE